MDEIELKHHLSRIVRASLEETLNTPLDAEADALSQARRYEQSTDSLGIRAGHYKRGLLTTAGSVTLKITKLRSLLFKRQLKEKYRQKYSSIDEVFVEIHLARVSVRRVEDTTEV